MIKLMTLPSLVLCSLALMACDQDTTRDDDLELRADPGPPGPPEPPPGPLCGWGLPECAPDWTCYIPPDCVPQGPDDCTVGSCIPDSSSDSCAVDSDCDQSTCPAGGCVCRFPEGECGGQGQCVPYPEPCGPGGDPVCGCDGQDYESSCHASIAGTSVANAGTCAPSCEGHCGSGPVPGSDPDCYCDDLCLEYNDCCEDYESVCSQPSASCEGHCGESTPVPASNPACFCDDVCSSYGDCCEDFATSCN